MATYARPVAEKFKKYRKIEDNLGECVEAA